MYCIYVYMNTNPQYTLKNTFANIIFLFTFMNKSALVLKEVQKMCKYSNTYYNKHKSFKNAGHQR